MWIDRRLIYPIDVTNITMWMLCRTSFLRNPHRLRIFFKKTHCFAGGLSCRCQVQKVRMNCSNLNEVCHLRLVNVLHIFKQQGCLSQGISVTLFSCHSSRWKIASQTVLFSNSHREGLHSRSSKNTRFSGTAWDVSCFTTTFCFKPGFTPTAQTRFNSLSAVVVVEGWRASSWEDFKGSC